VEETRRKSTIGSRGREKPAIEKISLRTSVPSEYWGNCQTIEDMKTVRPQKRAKAGWSLLQKTS
jgi:hypothetical protein